MDTLVLADCSHYCWLRWDGMVPYQEARSQQQALVAERIANPELDDVLWLLEHPSVYTLGRGANPEFLRFDPSRAEFSGFEVYRIERGGEVTHHCPGQLVGYPIVNLKRHRCDLHWYLRQLEEVVIRALRDFDLVGQREAGLTGVWVHGSKVAAIGIKVSRWITMHGFALNICPDLAGFDRIVPCGIANRPVGSLEQFCPGIDPECVRQSIIAAFSRVFAIPVLDLRRDRPSRERVGSTLLASVPRS
ncbi:MAG: lipoyl(octanoyl) transferase LipB [Cyanobacteria bacterium J06641_5]